MNALGWFLKVLTLRSPSVTCFGDGGRTRTTEVQTTFLFSAGFNSFLFLRFELCVIFNRNLSKMNQKRDLDELFLSCRKGDLTQVQ